MYLRIVFCEVPYTYDKVHDGYMLGICSNNIYPIPNPYVQRFFRRSRYMLTINDTKLPLICVDAKYSLKNREIILQK